MSESRCTVVFRQSGNNLRLGNTMVWIAAAHDWCARYGFSFCFPSARRVLGGLIHESSPLFTVPASLGSSPAGPDAASIDAWLTDLENRLTQQVHRARELPVAAGEAGLDARLVSLARDELGCITDAHGYVWEHESVLAFVRSHRVCVVNEPHPFRGPLPLSDATRAALLPPSEAAAALLREASGLRGLSVGLHVRQTDYRRWKGGQMFRDNEFYGMLARKALLHVPEGGRLVIAHDGEFRADADLGSDPRVEISGGTEAEVTRDFVRFATCDILLGPWSTFTVQAAQLGQLWAPKRRDLIQLKAESTLEELLSTLSARLSARPR